VISSESKERVSALVARPGIRIEDVSVAAGTLIFKVELDPSLEEFLNSGLFYFKYYQPIDRVPDGILSIPLLGCLASPEWGMNPNSHFTLERRRPFTPIHASLNLGAR